MLPESPAFFDPEARLREAIAAFEEARNTGSEPDQEKWLASYPDVADRLAEYFRGLTGASLPPAGSSEGFLLPPYPASPAQQRDLGDEEARQPAGALSLPRYPCRPEDWQKLEEPRPDMGVGAALGRLVLFLLIDIACLFGVGLVLGTGMIALRPRLEGLRFEGTDFILAEAGFTTVLAGFLGWRWLRHEAPRKMGLRKIAGIHLVLVLLLVPPLLVVNNKVAAWTTMGLDRALGKSQRQAVALHGAARDQTLAPAYLEFIDRRFDALARQPWLVMFLAGCLLPAFGEEVFFRGFLGRGLVARYGVVPGVLWTSVLFGLLHIDPVQIVAVTILGVVLHGVYLSTKSILGPMVLHLAYNAGVLSLHKLNLQEQFSSLGADGFLPISPLLFAGAAGVLVAVIVLLVPMRIRWFGPQGEEWSAGYPSAEIPPADAGARARFRRRPAVVALVGAIGFAGLAATSIPAWLEWERFWVAVRTADAFSKSGELAQAVLAYDRAIQAMPDQAFAYFDRGVAYHNLHKYELAIEDYSESLRLDSTQALAYANRADCYSALRAYDKAEADATAAIRLDPNQALGHLNRGVARQNLGKFHEAINDYTAALRLEPANGIAWGNRAECYNETGEYQKALAGANKAIQLEPRESYYYITRGVAYQNLRKFNDAIVDLTKAIRLNPTRAFAYQSRGWTYTEIKQPEKAVPDLDKAIELDSTQAHAYLDRGVAHHHLGHLDLAVADYTEAIRLDPKLALAYENRSLIHAERGSHEQAQADRDKARRLKK